MRPRIAVLLSLLAALAAVALPGVANAHPRHNHGLTIASVPNPINAGDGVLIYGFLKGSDVSNQPVSLYHRVGRQVRFTLVQRTRTDSVGFYDFPRADGVVVTNRSWFVRGPSDTHSRTIHERVAALVSLNSSTAGAVTGQPVIFSGRLAPAVHPFERVLLQRQAKDGTTWTNVGHTVTNRDSEFRLAHRFRVPGVYTFRAVSHGDIFNIAGASDSLTVTVQQRQAPSFTISSSDPVIGYGQSVTISGVLDHRGTNTVEPGTGVTLYGHTVGGPEHALATTTTGADGSYSFTQAPTENEVYLVRTTLAPFRLTAPLYEGVQDIVSLSATPTTVATGAPVTFTGTVSPAVAGHLVYLQVKDASGYWDNIGRQLVGANGSFAFTRAFGLPGTREIRARIYGGPENVGGASAPVTITVTGAVAPTSTLPPAS